MPLIRCLVTVALWLGASAAEAQARSGVALSFDGCAPGWSDTVRRELTTGLRDLAIEVGTGPEHALAEVRVVCEPAAPGRARLVVDDHVTDKHLERTVDEPAMPDAARAITVAIAAEELLRASWAEVALRGRALSPPPEVVSAVEDSLVTASDVHHALGVSAHATWFTGGAFVVGGELGWQIRVLERFVTRLGVGAFGAPPHTTRLGTIDAFALEASLRLGASVLDPGPVTLDLGALVVGGVLVGRGQPLGGALGRTELFGLVSVGGFAALGVRVDDTRLWLAADLAAVVLGAALETADGVAAALAGARLGLTLGVDVVL